MEGIYYHCDETVANKIDEELSRLMRIREGMADMLSHLDACMGHTTDMWS